MFFQLISRVICVSSGYIYPAFASYKAIKSNDLQKLEIWLMYWVVMGSVMTLEGTIEWIVSWIPFYYEAKTVAILWLTLPQIQGSTYIYVAHLHPFLLSHEDEIDEYIAEAKLTARQVGLEWVNKIVQRVRQIIVGTLTAQASEEATQASGTHPSQPITHPDGSWSSLANSYIRQYGPAAVAAGTALFHPMNGRAPSVRRPAGEERSANSRTEQMRSLGLRSVSESDPPESQTTGRSASFTKAEARRRRAELEAQIAALDSFAGNSSSPASAVSSSTSTAQQARLYHPRVSSSGAYPTSLSAGNKLSRNPSPSASGANSSKDRASSYSAIDRSFVEIDKEDLRDYPPTSSTVMQVVPDDSPLGGKRAGWWPWGLREDEASDMSSDKRSRSATPSQSRVVSSSNAGMLAAEMKKNS